MWPINWSRPRMASAGGSSCEKTTPGREGFTAPVVNSGLIGGSDVVRGGAGDGWLGGGQGVN